jgi:energy-coupling factor transporter ATP-binding protein EcfA2
MALVSDPDILFLDEPTSGLDVASSHVIRDIVTRMNRERGMTVFITTHNIEEAGDLCHRVLRKPSRSYWDTADQHRGGRRSLPSGRHYRPAGWS